VGFARRSLGEGLQLFALFGLAVAAPLLGLLARNPGFLVAHRMNRAELWLLFGALVLLLPLGTWLVERALGVLSTRLAGAVHLLLAAALAAAFVLPVLVAIPGVPGPVLLAGAALVGVAVALGLARRRAIRRFVAFLGILPLAVAGRFLAEPVIARLFWPPAPGEAIHADVDASAPVVIAIFDELPITSLLDRDGRIDSHRYPNFASIAAHSTWFANTSAVATETDLAMPAIVTGSYPDPSRLATAADYPLSLFSLLAGAYSMHVHEPRTLLYTSGLPTAGTGDRVDRAQGVASDLAVLYLHGLLPEDLTQLLPSVTETWRDFGGFDEDDLAERRRFTGRDEEAEAFIEGIGACDEPCLHFLHLLLPHPPWQFSEVGNRYEPSYFPGMVRTPDGTRWGSEDGWIVEAYQRHLVQLAFTDRILGDLLARLKTAGMYDDALIAIASDHGSCFWPDQARRDVARCDHPEDILRVVFLLKRPRQRTASVNGRAIETIDILPTIADVLGIEIPWPVDGCSALDPGCPERSALTVVGRGGRLSFSPAIHERSAALERKLALFGWRPGLEGLFKLGRHRALVGRRVSELDIGDAAPAAVEVVRKSFLAAALRPREYRTTRILGRFAGPPIPGGSLHVAVASRGVVRAVVPALELRGHRFGFSATLPDSASIRRGEELDLYLVTGPATAPRLHPSRIELGDFILRPRPLGR
jgi:hypothetical protein